MKERPILFSAPMVRAILQGRKTQTRRVIKDQPGEYWHPDPVGMYAPTKVDCRGEEYPGPEVYGASDEDEGRICSYGKPGDRLYVKEAWQATWHQADSANMHVSYSADGSEIFFTAPENYALPKVAQKPTNIITPIFMPRWASRITLEISEVRVQRVQAISEEDAAAEGWLKDPSRSDDPEVHRDAAKDWFMDLWESINGEKRPWSSNPWVWAISFRRIEK